MPAYYNEFDPYAAEWLRNLIAAGLIAPGDVDERSITEVCADDVRGYTQCHFFAGVGGWSYALRLAGWPDDREIWSGSAPCQPFSVAGKGLGESDPRHLWPEFRRLIAECRPATVCGEQVSGAAGLSWLAGVRADLEAEGYAVAAVDTCAAGCGAPHIRQRLYWVADAERHAGEPGRPAERPGCCVAAQGAGASVEPGRRGHADGGLGDPDDAGRGEPRGAVATEPELVGAAPAGAGAHRLPNPEHDGRGPDEPWRGPDRGAAAGGSGADGGGVEDPECGAGAGGVVGQTEGCEWGPMDAEPESLRCGDVSGVPDGATTDGAGGPWGSCWLPCRDGRWRRVEPGAAPLAHGVPRSVADLRTRMGTVEDYSGDARELLREARRYRKGTLRGMGNAIVPQVAAEFIGAYMDITDGTGGR